MFLNFSLEKIDNLLVYIDKLRENNIMCELYPTDIKIKKQMDYANQRGIDFVVIVGQEELNKNKFNSSSIKYILSKPKDIPKPLNLGLFF